MSSNSIETHRNSTVHHGSARELAEEIQDYGEYWKYKHVPQAIAKANPWNKQTNHKINKKVNTFMYVISAIFLCPGNHMGTSQTITYLLVTTDLFLPSVLLLTLFLIWLAGKKGHKYLLRIVNLTLTFKKLWGVSSVPFPFWFPFQLHCELVSSGISSQSVQNILIWHVTKP